MRALDRYSNIGRVNEFFDELAPGSDTRSATTASGSPTGRRSAAPSRGSFPGEVDLLVLDEVTGDLDSTLEREIQAAIERMESDYAVVTIVHRLSTVENANRLYTMDGGVERGRTRSWLQTAGRTPYGTRSSRAEPRLGDLDRRVP